MQEEIYVPLSALNAYSYCNYRMYLEYVQGEWRDNHHTIESILKHERAHSGARRYDKDRIQTTQVYVRSDQYRLIGKIDIIEERAGEVYPVEYKKGRAGKWINDHLQLCAQALCLEEQLEIEIDKGYLWYFASREREEVLFTAELREGTIKSSKEIMVILEGGRVPEGEYSIRCKACSIQKICLPQEMALLKAQKGED